MESQDSRKLTSRVLGNPLAWIVAGALSAALLLQCGIIDAHAEGDPYEQWVSEAKRNGDPTDRSAYAVHTIRLAWPDNLEDWAIRVARCESELRAEVVNWAGPYVGLFQIWTGHGHTVTALQNPTHNSQQAYLLYLRQGWGAWPVCQYR